MNKQPPNSTQTTGDTDNALVRLQNLDEKLKEHIAETQDNSSTDMPKLLQTSTALFSLLGLGLYGAVRFGQQVFYNAVQLTPEEVGLSYASSLSRAAVIIAAVSAVIVLYFSSVMAMVSFPETTWPRRILSGLTGLLLGLISVIAFSAIAVLAWGDIGNLIAGVGLITMSVAGLFFIVLEGGRKLISNLARRPAIVLTAVSLMTAAAFIASGKTADSSAEDVRNGHELSGGAAFGLLGLRAEHVKLSGDLPAGFTPPKNLSYLGRADGTLIVYDYAADEPIRLPANGVVISH